LLRELRYEKRSRFFWHRYPELAKHYPLKAQRAEALEWVTMNFVRFHPQWWLLNREAAEALVDEDFTRYFTEVFACDEVYFATVLRMKGYPVEDRVLRRDFTKVNWDSGDTAHPKTFETLTASDVANLVTSGCFLGRKFATECNLKQWKMHVDENGHQRRIAVCGSPPEVLPVQSP
jgi:hypothetical protein